MLQELESKLKALASAKAHEAALKAALRKEAIRILDDTTPDLNPELMQQTVLCYAMLMWSISFTNIVTGVPVLTLYTESFGLSLGAHTMVTAIAKSVDLLLGFAVGFASDQVRTPWGRRLPLIAVGACVAAAGVFFLTSPPAELATAKVVELRSEGHASDACAALAGEVGNCSVVQQCLLAAIDAGRLPRWNSLVVPEASRVATVSGLGLNAWLFGTFFSKYHGVRTLIGMPYEALGMELTAVYDQRSRLFGMKAFLNPQPRHSTCPVQG